jgi:hypothetical protein
MLKSAVFLFSCLNAAVASAAIVFLGPTPYRSQADSPFPMDAGFHLEDFEDGELNTPGVYQPTDTIFGSRFHGTIMGVGASTDSVDGDDGTVDGLNLGGNSFRSNLHVYTLTIPRGNQFSIRFDFDQSELGRLPDSAGFVITDLSHGPIGWPAYLFFNVVDALGREYRSPWHTAVDDYDRNGNVSDDLFFGISGVTAGIKRFTIVGDAHGDISSDFLEIDHFQYGSLVPEPAAWMLFALGLAALPLSRR